MSTLNNVIKTKTVRTINEGSYKTNESGMNLYIRPWGTSLTINFGTSRESPTAQTGDAKDFRELAKFFTELADIMETKNG